MNARAKGDRNQFITQVARICFEALFVGLVACSAQSLLTAQTAQSTTSAKARSHARKADPKPEPTQQELIEYLRGKLLSLSPSDGINDNAEVTFDPATTALTITRPDGRCVNFLNALDANNIAWEIFDSSDKHSSREELLRLTVTSVSGKTARTCYDKQNHADNSASSNRVRFLFSASQARQSPNFQKDMTKAIKKLIVLCGGVPEKNLF
jgi:hypothetical protein